MNRPDHCPLSARRVRALLPSAPALVLHMFLPPRLSVILPPALISIVTACSLSLPLSFTLFFLPTPSSAFSPLVILDFLHFSHPARPPAPRLPLSIHPCVSPLPRLTVLPPPGSQGEARCSGPAEGAEPAERGRPQGARRHPGPLGPARGGAPPQGRGAVREPPAPLVTGAGDAGGTGSKRQEMSVHYSQTQGTHKTPGAGRCGSRSRFGIKNSKRLYCGRVMLMGTGSIR